MRAPTPAALSGDVLDVLTTLTLLSTALVSSQRRPRDVVLKFGPWP